MEHEKELECRNMQARARTYQNIQILRSSQPLKKKHITTLQEKELFTHTPVVQAALESLANDPNSGRNPSREGVYFPASPPPKYSEKSIQITYPDCLEEASLYAVAKKTKHQS